MKAKSNKQGTIDIVHPTIFSISIFQSPEQFIALYLAIQTQSNKYGAVKYLQKLIQRTKSPPIALTYTKQFLSCSTESQIQLCIIRFISQLSDLSQGGKSMQASLSFIIDNSSFLTELRHNLTHRVMVKGLVIRRGQQMILNQLKQKYWRVMFQKIWDIYCVDDQKVNQIYTKIVMLKPFKEFEQSRQKQLEINKEGQLYSQYRSRLLNQEQNRLSSEYLFEKCVSNYQFKSLIHKYILQKVLPGIASQFSQEQSQLNIQIKVTGQICDRYINWTSLQNSKSFSTKTLILLSTYFKILTSLHQERKISCITTYRTILCQVIIDCIQRIKKNQTKIQNNCSLSNLIFQSEIILKKIRQIYILKYIQEFNDIIEVIPQNVADQVKQFYRRKQEKLGKKVMLV